MSESTEKSVRKRSLDEEKPSRIVGMMHEEQWQSRGAERQLQEKIWDPGGFQPHWRAQEQ